VGCIELDDSIEKMLVSQKEMVKRVLPQSGCFSY